MPLITERVTRPQLNPDMLREVTYSKGNTFEFIRKPEEYEGKNEFEENVNILISIAYRIQIPRLLEAISLEASRKNASDISGNSNFDVETPQFKASITKDSNGNTRFVINSVALNQARRKELRQNLSDETIERSAKITIAGDPEQIKEVVHNSFNEEDIRKKAETLKLPEVIGFLQTKRGNLLTSDEYNELPQHNLRRRGQILYELLKAFDDTTPLFINCSAFTSDGRYVTDHRRYMTELGHTPVILDAIQSFYYEGKKYLFSVRMKVRVNGEMNLEKGKLQDVRYFSVDILVKSLSEGHYSTPDSVFQRFMVELTGVPHEILNQGNFRSERRNN